MPPERVDGMARNGWTACIGIAGRHGPDYARPPAAVCLGSGKARGQQVSRAFSFGSAKQIGVYWQQLNHWPHPGCGPAGRTFTTGWYPSIGALQPQSLPARMLVGGFAGGLVSGGTQVGLSVIAGQPWNEGLGAAVAVGLGGPVVFVAVVGAGVVVMVVWEYGVKPAVSQGAVWIGLHDPYQRYYNLKPLGGGQ